MTNKIIAQYVDRGFGFPIVLENVPMTKVRGEWTPNINYNDLAVEVLRRLVELEGRLTGNQTKFIRHRFEMTLQQFAARFGVSHPAVLKWEGKDDRPTGMSWAIEKDIRLYVAKALEESAKGFLAIYQRLETIAADTVIRITVNAEKLAA